MEACRAPARRLLHRATARRRRRGVPALPQVAFKERGRQVTVRSRTWVEDNVTGVECDDTTEVPILIGDFEVTANLTAESRDALVALLRDDRDPEPLCKLLGVVLVETVEAEPAERRRRS